jgi:hypothetical protein
MKKLILALATATVLPAAQALDLARTWVNPGFYSFHVERDKNLNNVNTGLGIEVPLSNTYAFTAGVFENSNRATSHYVGLYVMPFEIGPFKAGAVVGGFNGYPNANQGGWFPALIPVIALEGQQLGMNVSFVPTVQDQLHGAISFQLKYRFKP